MPSPLKIIHFSDIHIWRTKSLWSDFFYPKRILGGLNLLLKRRKAFPPHLGKTIIADILSQDADLVIFSGDMTTASHPEEFAACAELFQPLRDKWGDRFFVIPGNHDRYTPKSVAAEWYEQSFPYGMFQQGIQTQEVTTPSEKKLTIVGIDASQPFQFRSNGLLTEALASQLEQKLQELKEAENQVILVGHYPIYYPDNVPQQPHHILLNKQRLQQINETYSPLLYLHGHKHQRWHINNTVNSGSCGMQSSDPLKQAGYAIIELEGHSPPKVTSRHITPQGTFQNETLSSE